MEAQHRDPRACNDSDIFYSSGCGEGENNVSSCVFLSFIFSSVGNGGGGRGGGGKRRKKTAKKNKTVLLFLKASFSIE